MTPENHHNGQPYNDPYMKLLQTFTKGNNFPDFQFALLNDRTLQNDLKS